MTQDAFFVDWLGYLVSLLSVVVMLLDSSSAEKMVECGSSTGTRVGKVREVGRALNTTFIHSLAV